MIKNIEPMKCAFVPPIFLIVEDVNKNLYTPKCDHPCSSIKTIYLWPDPAEPSVLLSGIRSWPGVAEGVVVWDNAGHF